MANKVDVYLEALENKLRDEMKKYNDMKFDEAIEECGAALTAVSELRKRVTKIQDVKSGYLII